MTSVGTALRRTLFLVVLAAAIGGLVSWRQRLATTPTPASAPVWPPIAQPSRPLGAPDSTETTTSAGTDTDIEQNWVPANFDGSVPASHPVKAKDASGIFHEPGGRFYERTKPDRCYPTAAAAEADGYRRSKS